MKEVFIIFDPLGVKSGGFFMIGIYKIASPSGKVYIGQSWDIPKRFNSYNYISKQQRGLFNSFKKYSIKHHQFEVVHQLPPDVSQEVMDTYEQLYMDAYRDAGVTLLNCREAGSTGKLCETTRALIIKSLTGRKNSEETKKKRALSITGRFVSDETKKKIGMANTGKKRTDEQLERLSAATKGKKKAEGFGAKVSKGLTGMAKSEDHKKALSEGRIASGVAKGTNNPKCKLTEATVIEIRNRYDNGELCNNLAREYNISKSGMFSIVKRLNWKHLA